LKVILFLGYSNSGKTTALTSVTKEIVRRRLGKVGTLKHIHHDPDFTIDTKGKDTWLHAASGASIVISLAPSELAIIKREPGVENLSLDDILAIFRREKVDYVLVEGLYRKFSRKTGVFKILCAVSEEQVLDLLKEHGSKNVVCITGKVALKTLQKEIQGIPILSVSVDIRKILGLIGAS
jgi:molybdopterin-guanine dinucleotide biosynthesis protein MobB